jgi:hypothetical protein
MEQSSRYSSYVAQQQPGFTNAADENTDGEKINCGWKNYSEDKLRQINLGQWLFRQENGRQIPNGRRRPSSARGASRADPDGTSLEPAPMDE